MDDLLWLVCRIAEKDHAAFARLHDVICGRLFDRVLVVVPHSDHAALITAATFVEIWSLARFHATDADVYTWISHIAARRIAERWSLNNSDPSAGLSDGRAVQQKCRWESSCADSGYDRQTYAALAELLDPQDSSAKAKPPHGDSSARVDAPAAVGPPLR